MNESDKTDEKSLVLRELKKMSKILSLANAPVLEKEISKIANSDARKKMWVLIDGKRMPKEIAKEAGVTQMAVSYFLTAAAAAEFVEYAKFEPPHRILDYVPRTWIDLVIQEKDAKEQGVSEDASVLTKADSAGQEKKELKP
jgi:predicted transcriptional regulator